MTLFSDCCCLVEFSREKGSYLKRMIPETFDFYGEINFFTVCSFPEKITASSIHSFSLSRHICYSWCFQYQNGIFSIVILSHHCFAQIFLEFLGSIRDLHAGDDPEDCLNAVNGYLAKWKIENNGEVHLVYPDRDFRTNMDSTYSYYLNFDPSSLIGRNVEYDSLWKALLTNKGVLIYGEDAEKVSNAVFSVISMVAPLKYCEPLLVFTRLGDERFADVIQGSIKWKIVGTTNLLAYDRCTQFKVVIKLPPKPSIPFDIRTSLQKRTTKILKRFELFFNKYLEKDPYSELLDCQLTPQQLADFTPKKDQASTKRLTIAELQIFQRTNTFTEWRKFNMTRRQFRESFLSFTPEDIIQSKSMDQLSQIEKGLVPMSEKFSHDLHMSAVINKHISIIRKKRVSSQSYSDLPDSH